ncbi:hypothetical protein A2U01_0061499, partial [Trifolium medium]|nr:hypothetical protein [Trifolium medium]
MRWQKALAAVWKPPERLGGKLIPRLAAGNLKKPPQILVQRSMRFLCPLRRLWPPEMSNGHNFAAVSGRR